MSEKPSTPNLDEMLKVHERSQEFFEIVAWLVENTRIRLMCGGNEPGGMITFTEVGTDRIAQKAVGRFFGIDLDEADRERDRLLDWVREQNAATGVQEWAQETGWTA
jgi:hypothetical protein